MGKIALVSPDISKGAKILDTLDRANVKLNVLMWAFLSEYEDWRLVISSRQLDSLNDKDSFRALHRPLDAAGFTPWNKPIFLLLPMPDPFIKDLRRRYAKIKDIEGADIGLQSFGDRWVEAAYVYRIT
jgi:hypothetical protein